MQMTFYMKNKKQKKPQKNNQQLDSFKTPTITVIL